MLHTRWTLLEMREDALQRHIPSVSTETFRVEPNTSFISTRNHGAHHDSHKNTGPGECWRVFTRNIGASFILNSFKLYSNRRDEPPKTVHNRSFTIALIRCSIHLLPIAVTVVLAYLTLLTIAIRDSHGISANPEGATGFLLGIDPTDPNLCELSNLVGGWVLPITGNSAGGWLE